MDRRAIPLPQSQLKKLRNHAENSKERLPVVIIAGTGISLQEFLHLRSEWIDWPGPDDTIDAPLLHIPKEAPCARTHLQPKHQTVLSPTEYEPPCIDCERQPGPDKFFVDYDQRVRTIPLVDKDAASTLRWWFSRHDCIPFGRDLRGMRTLLNRINVTNVSAQDLRWTFGRRLADMEFERKQIAEVMGVNHDAKTLLRVLRASSTDYGLRKLHTVSEYLDAIGKPGATATSNEIAARLDLQRQSVTKRLADLNDEDDRVEIVKKGRGGAKGYSGNLANVYRRREV